MRKSLRLKVFWLFAPLALTSILFGAFVLYGFSTIHQSNKKINLLKDFQLQLKELETRQPRLALSWRSDYQETFDGEIRKTEEMANTLVGLHSDLSPELLRRLKKIPFFMENFSRAYRELLNLYILDVEMPKKNVALLDKLHDEIDAPGGAGNNEDVHRGNDLLQKMIMLQAKIYHGRQISYLAELKKTIEQLSSFSSSKAQALAQEFGDNLERNYINYLALQNREEFLRDTAERFFQVAADTIHAVTQESRREQTQFVWAIFAFILAVIFFNALSWRLSSRYIKSFIENHNHAMSSIKNGAYDFKLPALPEDEIGDLTRAMQSLGTNLKDSLKKLGASQVKYRDLVDNLSDWIWEVDEDGRYTYASAAVYQILGYRPDEVLGKTPFDLMPEEEAKRVADIFSNTCQLRQPLEQIKNINLHKNGHEVILETTGQPIIDDDGVFFGYRGVDRDITAREKAVEEQARLEEQLVQAQKMESVGRLAGGVAHDFNNILTAINGYAELTLRDMEPDNPNRKDIAIILESGQRAARLTQQLLAFSRKQIIRQECLDINKELQEIHKMLERLISEDIEIETFYCDDIWPVNVDRSQLEQVVINLAVNASDAMPLGGKLTLETQKIVLDEEYAKEHYELEAGEYVMLAVSDSGEGMTKDVVDNIFEPFYTTKKDLKGTGLGLATVHGVIKQNGGQINVYSEPGHGTIFKIYLPKAEAVDEKQDSPLLSQADLSPGTGTILLVEDNEMVRELCLKVLQIKGYDVLHAIDGEEALAMCKEHEGHIDLLLTDVVMPKMNGTELAEEMSKIFPHIKILFMSGYTENAIVKNGILKGGVNFIHKPLSPHLLATKVQDLMSSA